MTQDKDTENTEFMTHNTEDISDLRRAWEAEDRRKTDLNDLAAERMDLNTGRAARFLTAATQDARREARGGVDKDTRSFSRLQLLLATNPAYAALYNDTMDKLRTAETATEAALQRLLARRDQLRVEIDDMIARAAKLPDGTAVFRAADGSVWTQHGAQITDSDQLASIIWTDNDPTRKAWTAVTSEAASVDSGVEELRDYQVNTLGAVREQMTDDDSPPSVEKIERLRKDIDLKAPISLTHHHQHGTPAGAMPTADIKIPDLS